MAKTTTRKPAARSGKPAAKGGRPAGRSAAPRTGRPAAKPAARSTRPMDAEERRPARGPIDENMLAGKNAVREALRSDLSVNKVWLAEGIEPNYVADIIDLCKSKGVPYHTMDRKKLDEMAGPDNRGVACEVAAAPYAEIEDMLALAKERGEEPLLVILDDVEDPHNLGAIIRTALCVGAHGVIIPRRRAASLNATVARTSAGASAHLPVARVGNIAQTIKQLQNMGIWVAAVDMDGRSIWKTRMAGALALVLGSEGKGVSQLVKSRCDFCVGIPMTGPVSSLNVSAAAAVALYEAVRQRCFIPAE